MLGDSKNNHLGLLVKKLLKERLLSMRKLSELTDIDTATISRIINGKRKANLGHLERFSECLEIPIAELFEAAGYPIEERKNEQQSDIHMSVDMIQNFLESSNVYDNTFSIALVEDKLTDYELYVQTDEGRNTILKDFEEKLKSVGSIGPFITQLTELFERFRSGKLMKYEYALIGSALLYFIIPVDVIPDYIFPIGYLDDAIAVKLVGKSLTDMAE